MSCLHLVKGASQSQWDGAGYLELKRKGRGDALLWNLWGWTLPSGFSVSPVKQGWGGGGRKKKERKEEQGVGRTPMQTASLSILSTVWFEGILLPVSSATVLFCSITNLNGLEMELLGQSGICYKTLWVFSWQERC